MFRQNVRITSNKLIKLMFVLMIFYMIFLPPRVNAILYPVRICTIISIFAIAVLTIRQEKNRFRRDDFLAFYVIISVIAGNFVAYGIVPNLDNVLSVISVLCLLLLISISDRITVDKSLIDFIYRSSAVMALIQIIYSQTHYAYWNGSRSVIYLVLGIQNSNTTAIILFLIYAMLIITMGGQKHVWFPILLEICLFRMIWLTNSRAIIIAAILLAVLSFGRRIKRIPPIIAWGCCAAPIIFVPFYLTLYKYVGNFEILGKSLFSGRQNTFMEYLACVDTPLSMLFGNLKMNMFQNAHNGPLAIFTSIGALGAAAYFYIVLKKIMNARKGASPFGNVAIIAILACFIHSCGEAALFLGGFPSIVFVFAMFLFAYTPESALKE